jgi:hypothetical protein
MMRLAPVANPCRRLHPSPTNSHQVRRTDTGEAAGERKCESVYRGSEEGEEKGEKV